VLDNPRSPRVRAVAKLSKKQRRHEARLFLVEGPQATREALVSQPERIEDVFMTPSAQERNSDLVAQAERAGLDITLVSEAVLDQMADTVTPQGVVSVAHFRDVSLDEVLGSTPRHVVVLHQVKDPGNVGNIIRSADAAGADAVILSEQSVDVYNPKVVRATTGSLFHVPIVSGVELAPTVSALRGAGVTVLATDAGGDNLAEVRSEGGLDQPVAWLLGNEAHGLAQEDQELADRIIAVPLYGQAESLSLQTAAAICMYETAFAQNS